MSLLRVDDGLWLAFKVNQVPKLRGRDEDNKVIEVSDVGLGHGNHFLLHLRDRDLFLDLVHLFSLHFIDLIRLGLGVGLGDWGWGCKGNRQESKQYQVLHFNGQSRELSL